MQFNLIAHPSTLPADPSFKVWAKVDHAASLAAVASTNIWFGIGAPASRFRIPEPAEPERAEGLWETTCFEVFLRPLGEEKYSEWNFSPSGRWQSYDFASYRESMVPAEVEAAP